MTEDDIIFIETSAISEDLANIYASSSRRKGKRKSGNLMAPFHWNAQFNDESDDWFLGGVSVASRRKFAAYAYNKAATGEGNWPTIRGNPLEQALIDNFVSTIDLGPTPVTI
ncbi:unnamed protein product [Umbelopsis ramanniana]